MGGRLVPMMGSNPPGFFQMPEMSCGSNGRFDGGACVACLCPLLCAKSICIKTNTATSANKAVRRYIMWRLPSKNTHMWNFVFSVGAVYDRAFYSTGKRAVIDRAYRLTAPARTQVSCGRLSASELQLPCSLALPGACSCRQPPLPSRTCRCHPTSCHRQRTQIEYKCRKSYRPWPERSSQGVGPQT